ncbi:dicarboxylate/amino acid:cation symporter, partial [Aeromonas sp. HMWF017]
MKMNKLTVAILISMMFGILTGQGYRMFAADQAADFANNITILTDIFLRLIKMIIAPLVFTTLVVGIAKMGDTRTVGRIGAKTLGWFMLASLMSLSLGLVMVTLMQPGVGLSLSLPNDTASSGIAAGAITLKDFVTHAIPKSVVEAMATNEILQIVVFSLFFGLAAAALGDLAKPVVVLMASAAEIMLKVTGYVMNFAPFAVFGAIAAMVAKEGLGILVTYG